MALTMVSPATPGRIRGPPAFRTAPNAIAHICNSTGPGGTCTGTEWNAHVELTPSAVLSDISTNCTLSGVSWVVPSGNNSDHRWDVLVTGGPSWVASIVNAVGHSTCADTINGKQVPYWNDTAIIVTWDDWGGCYDHEAPPVEAHPYGGYEMGFRVPLIVVSAYTSQDYQQSPEDFGSVARFIERNFRLGRAH